MEFQAKEFVIAIFGFAGKVATLYVSSLHLDLSKIVAFPPIHRIFPRQPNQAEEAYKAGIRFAQLHLVLAKKSFELLGSFLFLGNMDHEWISIEIFFELVFPFKVCQVAKAALGDQAQDSCAMAARAIQKRFPFSSCAMDRKKFNVFVDLAPCRLWAINCIKSRSGATGLCWCFYLSCWHLNVFNIWR